jgi:hypothetical protein
VDFCNAERTTKAIRPAAAHSGWIGNGRLQAAGNRKAVEVTPGKPAALVQKLIAVGKGAILLAGAAVYAVGKVPIVLRRIAVIVVSKITVLLIAGAV